MPRAMAMDMLNPIQPASMDRAEIKRDFGDKLCFWGSIDEHYSLPFGSPEEIRREVKERLTTMGKKGGLILAPTHHVQLDSPWRTSSPCSRPSPKRRMRS